MSPWKASSLVLGLVTAVTLATITARAVTSTTQSAPGVVIAEDHFNTDHASGWGTAEVGGAYVVDAQGATAKVGLGSAQALFVRPGTMFAASLPQAVADDVRSQVTFQLASVPKTGNGVYLQAALRQQANGDRFVATAHVLSNGTIRAGLSRLTAGKQVALSNQVAVGTLADAKTTLTIVAEVRGVDTANVRMRVLTGTATKDTWDLTATDDSDAVPDTGFVGMSAYVSSSARTMSVFVRSHVAWRLDSGSPTGSPSPTGSSDPTSSSASTPASSTTAPSTTASSTPTTSTPTPTRSAPATTPPPPAGSDGVGSAPLGSTSYAVPVGAVWVSPGGSDSAAGTEQKPLRTLARAVAVAPSGTTIVLKAGSYHESVNVPPNKVVTIQSAPRSVVWLDGSRVVSTWTRSASGWTTPWSTFYDRTPSYTGTVYTQKGWGFVDPNHPYAAYPDQIWVDGTALDQVGSAGAVTAGTFFADPAGKRLVLGTNPAGKDVRVSDLAVALSLRSAGSVVRGIGVRRYATPVKEMGTVRILGSGSTVENVISSDNATTGLTLLAANLTVRGVTTERNGLLGVHGNYADNISISDLLTRDNNVQHFNSSPVAGGIKLSRSRGITIKNSTIQDNSATGIWLDESCYNVVVINNKIANNSTHGLFLEISARAVVADNVITGSGSDGVKIDNTSGVRAWNNTFGDNRLNLEIVQDTRDYMNRSTFGHDPRQPFPDPTMTWKTKNIEVMNSILPRKSNVNLVVRDYTGARTATQMNVAVNGNHFTRTLTDTLAVWGVDKGVSQLRSVADIARTGAGSENTESVVGTAGTVAGRAATPTARPLPADIAALVGQPAGTRHLGAF